MTRILIAAIATTLFSLPAWAQDKDKPTAQQQKMKSCNAQASKKGMKGEERKAFMSDCLSADGKKDDQKMTAQQEKMKSCSADFKKTGKPGSEREGYMKECLSKG